MSLSKWRIKRNRASVASEKLIEKIGRRLHNKANTCLSNLIFLPLIFPNFYENMHAIRSPFFQDTGSVHASMEWTPLQTGGGVLGMDAPP